ncbi:MAG: hypothetical protein U9O83_02995 [Campylobacterota bacterium]|nr:hypothetical protein [Campylobacterota bacterium]
MAGVHFSFIDFTQLLSLTIGIADRLDENRAESFTLLYCDFSAVSNKDIDSSLEQVLRNSDSIINNEKNYFFVLPYTDKYGAEIVKEMFDEFFSVKTDSFAVCYPRDGETPKEILTELQDSVSRFYHNDLRCLDKFTQHL